MVGIQDDGLLELLTQEVALGAETVVVLAKFLKAVVVVGAINGLNDLGSVAVEGLTRAAGEGGLSGDGAVGAVEDRGGVGEAKLGR